MIDGFKETSVSFTCIWNRFPLPITGPAGISCRQRQSGTGICGPVIQVNGRESAFAGIGPFPDGFRKIVPNGNRIRNLSGEAELLRDASAYNSRNSGKRVERLRKIGKRLFPLPRYWARHLIFVI
jgi:hypothetical protein